MTITDWLLAHNQAKTSIYHTGKYCGDWKASTFPKGKPSFHFILEGECWLDVGYQERVLLEGGDVLFFFKNIPFHLVSSPEMAIDVLSYKTMEPLDEYGQGTSLLCGFKPGINGEPAFVCPVAGISAGEKAGRRWQ
jgi:hypothetical protein